MADIDIVPKERSYTWLWIVLALVILAVLWYALAGGGSQDLGALDREAGTLASSILVVQPAA